MALARRCWPLLVLALGALLPMARVLAGPRSLLVGTELSDVYKHAWAFWHVTETLGWPRTTALNHPDGGLFLDMMWAPALLMLPVTAVGGAVLSANLWMWLSLWLVGACTWWLARELVGDGAGALLGGLAAQTATPLLGYPMLSGVHERLGVWVFPLVVLMLLRIRDRGGIWEVAVAAGGLGFVALGCQAYGLYAGGLLLMGLPLWLGHPRDWLPRLKRLAPVGLALLLVMGAVYAVSYTLTTDPESLVPQPGRLGEGPKLILDAATVGGLLDPRVAASVQPTLGGDELYVLTYLGWMGLGLALVGAALARGGRRWDVRGLTALALLMALQSLGPHFQVGAQHFVNPLFVAMAAVIPHYGSNPPVWQNVLAVAPLLAPGIAAAIERAPRGSWALAGLAWVAIVAERAATLPVAFPLPVTAAEVAEPYAAIVEEGAVAEVPRIYRDLTTAHGSLFISQTAHERPVPHTINIGASPWDSYAPLARGVARDWGEAVACLNGAGYRYLVVHRDHFSGQSAAAEAIDGLSRAASVVADDGVVAVFDLGPVPGETTHAGPALSRSSMELVQQGLAGRPLRVGDLRPDWTRCPAR